MGNQHSYNQEEKDFLYYASFIPHDKLNLFLVLQNLKHGCIFKVYPHSNFNPSVFHQILKKYQLYFIFYPSPNDNSTTYVISHSKIDPMEFNPNRFRNDSKAFHRYVGELLGYPIILDNPDMASFHITFSVENPYEKLFTFGILNTHYSPDFIRSIYSWKDNMEKIIKKHLPNLYPPEFVIQISISQHIAK